MKSGGTGLACYPLPPWQDRQTGRHTHKPHKQTEHVTRALVGIYSIVQTTKNDEMCMNLCTCAKHHILVWVCRVHVCQWTLLCLLQGEIEAFKTEKEDVLTGSDASTVRTHTHCTLTQSMQDMLTNTHVPSCRKRNHLTQRTVCTRRGMDHLSVRGLSLALKKDVCDWLRQTLNPSELRASDQA